VAGQATLLEALQAGIATKLAVLDDPDNADAGESSAELPGVQGGVLAETLAGHLVREIMVRGSRGGPLGPLADQLNHDVTHLQGQRLEGMLARLADQVTALAQAGSGPKPLRKPIRLAPRPVFLAGREELLAELGNRLAGDEGAGQRVVALYGLGGAGKTSVALEYAHRQLGGIGVAWQLPAEYPTVLAAGFGELAAQLDAADRGDPVASVHSVLAVSPEPWLLVFDNAPDGASVAPFVPPAGPGRVLITTQNQHWPRGQALQVPGRAAAGVGAGRRVHAGHRDPAGRIPAALPGPAGRPAGPRRGHRAPGGRSCHAGAGVVPAGGRGPCCGRAGAVAGIPGPRAGAACPAAR
jgi:hypothetical protein